jgi:hypothetical protein
VTWTFSAIAAGGLAAGAIANRSGAVVGISNVFSRGGLSAATWAGIAGVVNGARTIRHADAADVENY